MLTMRCIDIFITPLSSMQLRQLGSPFAMTGWIFLERGCTPRMRVVYMFVSEKMTSSASSQRSHFVSGFYNSLLRFGVTRAVVYVRCSSLVSRFRAVASVHAWHRFGVLVQFVLFLANLFLGVYARYVDDLFSLEGVELPVFNSNSSVQLVRPR